MTQTFEGAGKLGREFFDTGMKSVASVAKNAQAIAAETSDYTKRSFESGGAMVEKLCGAQSLEKAVEIQSDFAKQAYEGLVAQSTKLTGLYADMAKDAYKPFEAVVAKAK